MTTGISSLLSLHSDPQYLEAACEALSQVPDYPYHELHDRDLLKQIIHDFPEVDILEQLKAWRWYRVDHQFVLKNPRGSLRRWMLRAREFGL